MSKILITAVLALIAGCAAAQPIVCMQGDYVVPLPGGDVFAAPGIICDTEAGTRRRILEQLRHRDEQGREPEIKS